MSRTCLHVAIGMLALIATAQTANAEQQCFGAGSERYCRDVRSDGSAPPGYRYQPPYNPNDPNLAQGGARTTPLYNSPDKLRGILTGRPSQ